jgi:hypothetical protein
MSGRLPIERAGMAELTNDHVAQRLATDRDWNNLTFGEQHEYETRACRTAGAVYQTRVSERSVGVTVELPESLAFKGLSAAEAKRLENDLHRAMESAIAWFTKWRQQQGGRP